MFIQFNEARAGVFLVTSAIALYRPSVLPQRSAH
jgi:hypothetical protein